MFNTQKISAADVIEVEAALRALLRSEYPEISVERGSVLNDLVITSLSYLAAAIKSDVTSISNNMYLANLELSDSSDSFLLLQDLASNFLVSIADTPPKRGRVTFRFTTNVIRTIPADITLTRGDNSTNVKLFSTSQDILINSEDYLEVQIDSTTLYEYTVLMESVRVADDVSIIPGNFNSSATLTDLESIFNRSSFVGQTSTEFAQNSLVQRMHHSLQNFTFTSQRGIQATILNEGLPNLIRVRGVGAGDKEMYRDVIPQSLSSSRFHSLGMVNVVLSSTTTFETMPLSAGAQSFGGRPILGVITATGQNSVFDLVSDFNTVRYVKSHDSSTGSTSITSQIISVGQDIDPGTVRITVPNAEDHLINGSSTLDKFTIEQHANDADVASLEVIMDNNIPTVQGLIDSDEYNSLGSSILAMGSCVVQVLIPTLRITLARNVSAISVNLSRIKSTLTEFINLWDAEYPLSVGELQLRLGLVYSGTITSFDFANGVTYIAYLPDGKILPFTSATLLGIEDDSKQLYPNSVSYSEDLVSLQISNRVLNYLISPEDINIEVQDV